MKISIVTATFNSGLTLRDTLYSILNQKYCNYEILIIDGGSTDNTEEIVNEFIPIFGGKLKWFSGKDKGIYDAMNKGISLASGEVIGILNSDDFYSDSSVLGRIAEGLKQVEVVYGDLDLVDSENTKKIIREWRGSQYCPGAFLKGWHPAHPTFYAKKFLFDKFGAFDISFNVSADFELMFRFIEVGKASNKYIPYTFVKMRMGGESTGSIKKIIEGNRNVLEAFKKNGYDVPKFYLVRRLFPKFVNLIKNKIHN